MWHASRYQRRDFLVFFLQLLLYPPPIIPARANSWRKTPTDISHAFGTTVFMYIQKRPGFSIFRHFRHFHHENEVILKFLQNSNRMVLQFATQIKKKFLWCKIILNKSWSFFSLIRVKEEGLTYFSRFVFVCFTL